jgi:hypothetical protein
MMSDDRHIDIDWIVHAEEEIVVYNSNAREFQKLEEWLEKQNLNYKKRFKK